MLVSSCLTLFRLCLCCTAHLSLAQLHVLYAQVDSDSNGKIGWREFAQMLQPIGSHTPLTVPHSLPVAR